MNKPLSNKLLTGLVILLLMANAATLTFLWIGRPSNHPGPGGDTKEFLTRELNFDAKQQEAYGALVKEHRQKAEAIREQIKDSKEAMFSLLSMPAVKEDEKVAAAKKVSEYTEALDLLTLNHFEKVRALCNPAQQQKFDAILKQIPAMMGGQRPPLPPGDHPQGPPPPPRD